jgi:hypothetical protein
MQRKLASIQRIAELRPIPGADAIEVARVLGWECVVKRGEFKVGDLCVYFEVDSLLPVKPEFAFMADRKYRVRTIKLRGQVSQGLAFPLDGISYADLRKCKEGDDVTERLGVLKHEPNMPQTTTHRRMPKSWFGRLVARVKGWLGIGPKPELGWPAFLRKTDEIRIQSCPSFLERHKGEGFYLTEKLDGCSCTVYLRKGRFGVCSRNTEIDPKRTYSDQRGNFWPLVRKLGVETRMRALGRNLAIQGEVIGPDCNGNKYGLQEYRLFLFNVYDLDCGKYLDFSDAAAVADQLGLTWCPIIGTTDLDHTVDKLVAMSKGKTRLVNDIKGCKPIEREGIVMRALKEAGDRDTGRASFKVINPDFLLKFGE